jgi:hypothetical protein
MATKGRPALTAETVQQRITGYCSRYGVTAFNAAGFPVYPAGKRETPQHREWVLLYKAFSRLARRTAPTEPRPGAECPVCLNPVAAEAGVRLAEASGLVLHRRCGDLLRGIAELGPGVLDRIRAHLWPAPAGASPKKHGRRR